MPSHMHVKRAAYLCRQFTSNATGQTGRTLAKVSSLPISAYKYMGCPPSPCLDACTLPSSPDVDDPSSPKTATPSSPARTKSYYTITRSHNRLRPVGTAFLLFPAAAIGVGVSTGYISLNPFSSSLSNMSSKLIPSNPAEVMVIRNITPNVATFSVPFKRFGTVPIGGRGTVGKC